MYRNGKLFAIHSDHLGTPRMMTDESKAVVWQWPYSAFGNNKPTGVLKATVKPMSAVTAQAVQLEATPAVEMNLRMPGQYFDVETGNFHNGYRTYCPQCGRYLQSDPVGQGAGFNRYLYVNGNPLVLTDSLGLATDADVATAASLIRSAAPGLFPDGAGHVQMTSNLSNPFGMQVQGATSFLGQISMQANIYGTSARPVNPLLSQEFIQTLAHEMYHKNQTGIEKMLSKPDNELHRSIENFAEAIGRVVTPEFDRRRSQLCLRP
jgi:RHS repeat-associated protein